MQDTDLAWMAGIIDGEGCITITRRSGPRHVNSLYLRIANTNETMILRITELFRGAKVYYSVDKRPQNKPVYIWQKSGKPAAEILKQVFPYLVAKRAQAEIAIAFTALPRVKYPKGGTPADLVGQRKVLYDKIRVLNQVGTKRVESA
jgi:hypothetical protein